MLALSEYRSTDTNMIMADVQMMANTLMFDHGLLDQGWFVNFDRSKTRLGLCSHTKKEITLSKYLTPLRSFDDNRDTILHEIAHALVGPGHGHGAVWELKCVEIGARPERCGQLDPDVARPEFRWTYVCEGCGTVGGGMHRAPGRLRSCTKCSGGEFSFDHLFTWLEFGKRVELGDMPEKFQQEYRANLAAQHKIQFNDLLNSPELDDWEYAEPEYSVQLVDAAYPGQNNAHEDEHNDNWHDDVISDQF
jgi:hypothetical protein